MTKYISVTDPKYRRTKDENEWPREKPSPKHCIIKEENNDKRRRDKSEQD